MTYLLDTHVLLWWLADDRLLSTRARNVIANPKHTIFVSAISAWEISIKKKLGKLKAPAHLDRVTKSEGFNSLSISLEHGEAAGSLPNHHTDPFDRMLIAQGIYEKLTIITHDFQFSKYKVSILKI